MATINSGTKLINKSDIRRILPVKGLPGDMIASCAMSLLGFNRINRLYPRFGAYKGREFTKEAMKTFGISADILPEEADYIPKDGPFIVVSNHPFGGWDGIVLYNTVAAIRPDFRILANFILSLIPNLSDCFPGSQSVLRPQAAEEQHPRTQGGHGDYRKRRMYRYFPGRRGLHILPREKIPGRQGMGPTR